MPMAEYRCPCCKKPLMERGEFFPFCSARCKTNDLGAWASGKYAIPGDPVPMEELPLEETFEHKRRRSQDDAD